MPSTRRNHPQPTMSLRVRLVLLLTLTLVGCGHSRPYSLEPVRLSDPDDRPVPVPEGEEEHFHWEAFYLNTVHHLKKAVDLPAHLRAIGRLVGLDAYDEADNVNVLDEAVNSSWFTRRHFYHPMTLEELRLGPDTNDGPDISAPLVVTGAKTEGVTPGFFIRDARGDQYLLKFDPPDHNELTSSSEVIVTKLYHAAGYNVPQNTITYFSPDRLVLAEDTEITREQLEAMLAPIPRREDGRIRALASRFVDGKVLGIWRFRGTDGNDPNDRVAHEERRELRGLGVLAAWLNDIDRRDGNTMAVYVGEPGNGHVRHYLLDMGATLGTAGRDLRAVKRGYEYRYDYRTVLRSLFSLGLYERPWLAKVGDSTNYYPAVGYFESDLFHPGRWVPNYPNPAFEAITPRDGYWGAKLVTSFTDEQIRAVVDEGEITDPEARSYLIETLIERRDEIGRYWFSRVNPLDRFRIEPAPETAPEAVPEAFDVWFEDLAVVSGLEDPAGRRYAYEIVCPGGGRVSEGEVSDPRIALVTSDGTSIGASLGDIPEEERVCRIRLQSVNNSERLPHTDVYVFLPGGDDPPRVVGIDRDS